MATDSARTNIILIGPPGVGKSTAGVLIAKELSMGFVDTDVVIQSKEGRRLQEIIDSEGIEGFNTIEEKHILGLQAENSVIATGGSVVYSPKAMSHLKGLGQIVFLSLPCGDILQRLENLATRGVVLPDGMTFEEMYAERLRLYEQYADHKLDCTDLSHQQVVDGVAALVSH